MSRRGKWIRRLFGAMITLLMLSGVPAFGGSELTPYRSSCLKNLSYHVNSGEWIRVVTKDNTKFEGGLESINFNQSLLTLIAYDDTSTTVFRWEISDIAKIQYREPGKVKAVPVVVGILLGGIVGMFGGAAVVTCESDEFLGCLDEEITGAVIGGVIGALAGGISGGAISRSSSSTWTLKCK